MKGRIELKRDRRAFWAAAIFSVAAVAVASQLSGVPVDFVIVAVSGLLIFLSPGITSQLSGLEFTGPAPTPTRRRLGFQAHAALIAILTWLLAYALLLGPNNNQLLARVGTCVVVVLAIADSQRSVTGIDLSEARASLVLFEIGLGAVVVRASSYFGAPGVPGIDPWFHLSTAQNLLVTGSIPKTIYFPFPLFHISVASTSAVSGLSIRTSMFIVGSVVETAALVFGYLIMHLFASRRFSVLAAMAIGFSIWDIRWGFWITAVSLAIPIFAAAVFLFLRATQPTTSHTAAFTLFLVLVVAINLIHPTVSFIFAVTLTLLAVPAYLARIARRHQSISKPRVISGVALTWIVLVSYWLYVSGTFVLFVVFAQRSLEFDRSIGVQILPSGERSIVLFVLDRAPFYLLEILSTLGILVGLRRPDLKMVRPLALSGALLLGLSLVLTQTGPLAGFTSRFVVFGEILLAVPAIVGLYALATIARSAKRKSSIVLLVVMLFVSLAVVNYQTAAVPIIPRQSTGSAQLSMPEMTSARTIAEMANGVIVTDDYMNAFVQWSLGHQAQTLQPVRALGAGSVVVLRPAAAYAPTFSQSLQILNNSTQAVRLYDSSYLVAFVAVGSG